VKVFLGGTCNESTWRDALIPLLEERGIDYFNPVVPDWTLECMEEERKQREECGAFGSNNICLYVITKEMTGVYSIAEAVDDSNKRPYHTVFCVLQDGFDEGQLRSLNQVGNIIQRNGGVFACSLAEVMEALCPLRGPFVAAGGA